MLRIVRSSESESDLLTLSEWIGADNPSAAARWLDEIDRTVQLLATFPNVGESVERYGPGVRRISLGAYVILFRPIEGDLELMRVLHGSRNIDRLFE